jgi:hypothetical protein
MAQSKKSREFEYEVITALLFASQLYCRASEGDPSVVSLRDVQRAIRFMNFFLSVKSKGSDSVRLLQSVVLGLAFVYYYRQSTLTDRNGYWKAIYDKTMSMWSDRKMALTCFRRCLSSDPNVKSTSGVPKMFAYIQNLVQTNFCQKLRMDDDIALNETLSENLFVTIICILNRVPIFLVGKPGTSKSITCVLHFSTHFPTH